MLNTLINSFIIVLKKNKNGSPEEDCFVRGVSDVRWAGLRS